MNFPRGPIPKNIDLFDLDSEGQEQLLKSMDFLLKKINHLEQLITVPKVLEDKLRIDISNLLELIGKIDVERLAEIFKDPIKIDDRNVRQLGDGLISAMIDLKEHVSYKEFEVFRQEMKFLAESMSKIQESFSELLNKGISQKIDLKFFADGYEMVKKPLHYDPEVQLAEKETVDYGATFNGLTDLQKEILSIRWELFGKKFETYKNISAKFKKSAATISALENKAIRILVKMPNSEFKSFPSCVLKTKIKTRRDVLAAKR